MDRPKRSTHETKGFVILFGVIFVVVAVAAHVIGREYANRAARFRLFQDGYDYEESLNSLFASVLRDKALNITRFYGSSTAEITKEDLRMLSEQMQIDEISISGTNRCWIVATDENAIGQPLTEGRGTAEFLSLYDGAEPVLIQDFRRSVSNPEIRAKYVAAAFPDRSGVAEVGIYESSLSDDRYGYFDHWTDDWFIGKTGHAVAADGATGIIVGGELGFVDGVVGRRMGEIGLVPVEGDEDDFSEPRTVKVGGEPCWVSSRTFAGHEIFLVLPKREFAVERSLIFILPLVMLVIVSAVVAFVLRKRNAAREAIESMRDAELERLESDIRLAAVIQHNSLPQIFPPYPEIADRVGIYAAMKPAREVGGDFYDFRRIGANRLLFAVADVSDKGVPAAMFMMRAKVTLLGECSSRSDLAAGVEATNRQLCAGNDDGMFVTAWVGLLDLTTGSLHYVNAGHNPPLLRRADGTTKFMEGESDLPLGVMEGESYVIRESRMTTGDVLLVYTDGVTEAANTTGDLFGDDRLVKTCSSAITDSKDVCDNVLATVATFASGASQSDDITVMAIRLNADVQSQSSALNRLARRTIRTASRNDRVARAVFPAAEASVEASAEFIAKACPGPDAAVVIDELVSNIVRCSQAKTFSISVTDGRTIEVSDDGIPFNPLLSDSADIESLPDGGVNGHMGLFIVRQLAESVVYERKGDRNVLTVTMKPQSVRNGS